MFLRARIDNTHSCMRRKEDTPRCIPSERFLTAKGVCFVDLVHLLLLSFFSQ